MLRRRGGVQIARDLDVLMQCGTLTGLSDEQLLARFLDCPERSVAEAILERHGPLVLSVCRQLLSDPNDVDDAFQATFLVFLRKAATIKRPGSLASWLYGVAYRTAAAIRRKPAPVRMLADPLQDTSTSTIQEQEELCLLHQEIDRLPEKYRQPIVLCYLEGLTHDDAAARLCWPIGTVRGRLARARDKLRDRLDRRGASLTAGMPSVLARLRSGPSSLPDALLRSTAALLDHGVSLRLSHLAQGVVFTMFMNKLRWVLMGLSASALVLLAAGTGLRHRQPDGEKGSR